jgi:hypothetical protein
VALDHSCQVQRHSLAERGLDLYETPAPATETLFDIEPAIPKMLWEPAAGNGAITIIARDRGRIVLSSDIVQRAFPLDFVGDFLAQTAMPGGCEAILTNPPFRDIERFVVHALKLSSIVIMLARLAFYESDRRSHILENCGLARIHCFRKRLPMMHRAEWAGRKANSGMAFAWFIWERSYTGPTLIDRISWER